MIIFNLKNVLEDAGIDVVIMNEFASSGAGDLATFDTWPELWVGNDSQFEQAQEHARRYCFQPEGRLLVLSWLPGKKRCRFSVVLELRPSL